MAHDFNNVLIVVRGFSQLEADLVFLGMMRDGTCGRRRVEAGAVQIAAGYPLALPRWELLAVSSHRFAFAYFRLINRQKVWNDFHA